MMPDKIYVRKEEMGDVWALDATTRDNGGEGYIRKDALMEWATTNRDKLDVLSDNDAVRWGQRNAFQQMIDKLNSM